MTNPSRASYVYRLGGKGRLHHLVKGTLLRLSERLATSIFTYHSALVCRSPRP